MKRHRVGEYAAFQRKIMRRFCLNGFISVFVVVFLYLFLLQQRFGDWTISLLEYFMKIKHEHAFYLYHNYFRGYKEIFFGTAMILVFVFLLWHLFHWMTRYFREINQGIDALLAEDAEQIRLSAEMLPFEYKLNTVKQELERREAQRVSAEQRKDELVMYLAHDIRTPLTSVIGYLNLLAETPDMPVSERAKNVHITLEKANRLEEMVNEFFQITRLNSGQIQIAKERIDLYYMLVQLCEEVSPMLNDHGNSVKLQLREDMVIYADPDKIARVFSNILKNAAAYSYPNTVIMIYAEAADGYIIISFQNEGKPIPAQKLPLLFDKFYRMDTSRISDTGGTGLGLAIAKEIVSLHGGTIWAESGEETVTFFLRLPVHDEMVQPELKFS